MKKKWTIKRRNPLTKKNVVKLLALILLGNNTNQKLSRELKIKPQSVHQQIKYLKDVKAIYLIDDKDRRFNEKVYTVNMNKITEKFLVILAETLNINKKILLKFKDNDFISLTLAWYISNNRENEELLLSEVFGSVFKIFIRRYHLLKKGEQSEVLKGYTTEDIQTKNDFISFLQTIGKIMDEEEKRIDKFGESE